MSPDPWPSRLAWELLEEAEADPHGHETMDLDRLLAEWGITEPLPGQEDVAYRAFVHPEARHFPFRYPVSRSLSHGTVLHICRAIRTLHRELTHA